MRICKIYRDSIFFVILITGIAGLKTSHCAPEKSVVIYTAHDRIFSEPILDQLEAQSGIEARSKYDTEATKTIGLVNTLIAEKNRPRCDVWWNNEILNTIRLKRLGLLEKVDLDPAEGVPVGFTDPDGYWFGFAARARVIIVNTDLVPEGEEPDSVFDLTQPRWKGRAGIAKPLFGTTATHIAVMYAKLGEDQGKKFLEDLKANDVSIESGNRVVARKVAAGELAIGLTDTDDAFVEIQDDSPVKIIFPDQGAGQIGTLLIPNTVAKIKDGPNGQHSAEVIRFLLSPQVESALAISNAAQIPLNPAVKDKPPLPGLETLKIMEVDFEAAATFFEKAQVEIEKNFLQ